MLLPPVVRVCYVGFLSLFLCAATLILLAADAAFTWSAYDSLSATAWPTTPGLVVRSAVVAGDFGPDLELRYRYRVAGRKRVGERYCSTIWAGVPNPRAVARAHRAGRVIRVYYNPHNPDEALVRPGLHPVDLMNPFVLFPFHAIVAYLWIAWGGWVWRSRRAPESAGVPVFNDSPRRYVGISPAVRWNWALGVAAVVSLIVTFVAGPYAEASTLPLWTLAPATGLVVLTGVWGYRRPWRRSLRKALLVVDFEERIIQLPRDRERDTELPIPLDSLQSIFAREIPSEELPFPALLGRLSIPVIEFVDPEGKVQSVDLVDPSRPNTFGTVLPPNEGERFAGWLERMICGSPDAEEVAEPTF